MMAIRPVRVVYDNRPYLVMRKSDGSLERAYGPFAPGTEPSVAECQPNTVVRSSAVLDALELLLPLSPELPPGSDTLAAG
jgi:hypothetical protein